MNQLTEFTLINRFFARAQSRKGSTVTLGIGDDCALLAPSPDYQLAISTDMLVQGRHFFADVDPRALGHKALAVNLSDLAAMGATPQVFLLSLALPEVKENWLADFSEGLFALANQFDCELIGGDTTAGPLNLCLTVIGRLKANPALKRAAAQIDDDIWVSGMLGDARLALGVFRGEWEIDSKDWPTLRRALEWPQPRISLGQALLGTAHAAIDLSDGLAGDLQHIVQASNVAASVEIDKIPRSSILSGAPQAIQQRCMLSGGDDYELCFTAPQDARDAVEAIAKNLSLPLTRIGKIVRFPHTASSHMTRIMWLDSQGKLLDNTFQGFDHFHAD